MDYKNNIQILNKTSFGHCLIKVGPEDKLSRVGLLGKIIRWVKSLGSKKAFDDCKITKIADVLKHMVESKQINETDKAFIKQKFDDILNQKSLKEPNKKVIQEIYQNLFPPKKNLKNGTDEKMRISELAEKVTSEGFAAMQTATDADLLAVVEQLAQIKKLDQCLLIGETTTPLLHTAINSLNETQALLVVRAMIEKGANPHSCSLRTAPLGGKSPLFQSHAVVLAEEKEYFTLKVYLVELLALSEEEQKNLFCKAEATPYTQTAKETFEELIDHLTTLDEDEIFEKIDLLARKNYLNTVKVQTYDDGSEEQFTLLVAADCDLKKEMKWKVINKLIDSGANANIGLVVKKASGKIKKRDPIALKIFGRTMKNWNKLSSEEVLRNIRVCASAGLVNIPYITRKDNIAETNYLLLNAVIYLRGPQRAETVKFLLENGANPTVQLITQDEDDVSNCTYGPHLDLYITDDPDLKDLLALAHLEWAGKKRI